MIPNILIITGHFRLTESRMVSIMRARKKDRLEEYRGLAQSGSAPALGAGCRGFKSLIPDQFYLLMKLGSVKNRFMRSNGTVGCCHECLHSQATK